jgi:hypothetical protein
MDKYILTTILGFEWHVYFLLVNLIKWPIWLYIKLKI